MNLCMSSNTLPFLITDNVFDVMVKIGDKEDEWIWKWRGGGEDVMVKIRDGKKGIIREGRKRKEVIGKQEKKEMKQ